MIRYIALCGRDRQENLQLLQGLAPLKKHGGLEFVCFESGRTLLEEYARGRTPNPCVLCNRRIKFGALLDDPSAYPGNTRLQRSLRDYLQQGGRVGVGIGCRPLNA